MSDTAVSLGWSRAPLRLVAVCAYLALTLAGALHLVEPPDGVEAAPRWLEAAYGWWWSLTFWLLAAGSGRTLCRRLALLPEGLPATSRSLFHVVCGLYLLSAALLVLALVGASASLTLAALALAGVVVARDFLRAPMTRAGLAEPAGSVWSRITWVACIAWVVLLLPQTLLPNSDWDAALHHLPAAARVLDGAIGELDPAFAPWAYPGAFHVIYALFLQWGAEAAITPFNFLATIWVAIGVHGCAVHLFGREAGLWAVWACLTTNLLWELGLDARVDGFLALTSLAAAHAFLAWARAPGERGMLLAGAMALGLAVGTKYTGLVVAGTVCACALAFALAHRGRVELVGRRVVVAAVLLAAVPSSWWYARNAIVLGDPVYPLLSGERYRGVDGGLVPFEEARDRLLDTLPSEREMAGAPYGALLGVPGGTRYLEPANMLNLVDVVRRPYRYARTKLGHTIGALLLLALLLPIACRNPTARRLWVLGVAMFVVIGTQRYLLRYAAPVWPLFAVAAGAFVAHARMRPLAWACGALVAWQLSTNAWLETEKLVLAHPLRYLSGAQSRLEWLAEAGYHRVTVSVGLLAHVRALHAEGVIEESDSILMVGEGKGFLLPVSNLPDASWTGYRWLELLARHDADLDAIAAELESRGVRYLVFNYGYVADHVQRLATSERMDGVLTLHHLDRFLRRYGQALYNGNRVLLVRLVPCTVAGGGGPCPAPSR